MAAIALTTKRATKNFQPNQKDRFDRKKPLSEQVHKFSPGYGIKVDYSKRACSTKLSSIIREIRKRGMLHASDFGAIDKISIFVGGLAYRFCGRSCETIT